MLTVVLDLIASGTVVLEEPVSGFGACQAVGPMVLKRRYVPGLAYVALGGRESWGLIFILCHETHAQLFAVKIL